MNETATQHLNTESPFVEAQLRPKRLKVLVFGESGAGKTTFAVQFPKNAVADLERGAELYGASYHFSVLNATTFDDVMHAVGWLRRNKHGYSTFTLDPITVAWESLQKKWSDTFLRRNKDAKAFKHEFYELGPREWGTIKSEWRELMRQLLALDMNVICTARQKTLYADGGFMKPAGTTFDAEKSLAYLFDIVLRLFRNKNGQFMAEPVKDRSNKLPKTEFEISYQLFADMFGEDILTSEARPLVPASEEQVRETRALIVTLGIRDDVVRQRLATFGAERIEDLSADAAVEIIGKLKAARDAKTKTTPTEKEA